MTFRELLQRIFTPKKAFNQPHTETAVHRPTPEWIVIGLGNPGNTYARNRHNVGYMAVDALLEGTPLTQRRGLPVEEARLKIGQHEIAVLRSTTYMNNSGKRSPLSQKNTALQQITSLFCMMSWTFPTVLFVSKREAMKTATMALNQAAHC